MFKKNLKLVGAFLGEIIGLFLTISKVVTDIGNEQKDFKSIIIIIVFFVISLLLLGLCVFYVVTYIKEKRHESRSKESSIVAKNAGMFVQQLEKLTDAIDAKLESSFSLNTEKAYKIKLGEVVDEEKRIREEAKDHEIREKIKASSSKKCGKCKGLDLVRYEVINYTTAVMADAGNETKMDRFYAEAQTLCKEILSLSRELLQISQNALRIKLGRFVVKYSLDKMQAIKALIDLVGFTYILDGKYEEGKCAIMIAEKMCDELIKDKPDEKLYVECMMQKARGHRHLSTTYYTFDKEEDNIKTLLEGEKFFQDEKVQKYYSIEKYTVEPSKITIEYKPDYYKMKFGYDTNKILNYLFDYYKNNNNEIIYNAYKYLTLIDKDLVILNLINIDRHRIMKLKALKLQYVRMLSELGKTIVTDVMDNNNVYDLNKFNVENELKDIEDIIGDNIYLDDAIEMYTSEKIHYCFKEADKKINNR